jgi:hypothetical protein
MKKIFYPVFLFIVQMSYGQFVTNTGIQITNTSTLTTNGDWKNNSGTAIKNDGAITTSDSWINDGTLSGTGGFVLNYAVDKNFKSGSPSIGYLIKKGNGAALVSGSMYVIDSLFLSGGLLKFGQADTLWIKTDVVNANSSSYVEGLIANSGTGDKLFPFGRDGNYLPLKLIKLNATKATASVVSAPAGYSAGPGVEALITFPYVWKVSEKIAADTSAYVEVKYPNTLPTATNPIVTREVPGLKYASMGARAIDNSNGVVTVRSYSRGLKGTYTIAKGFPSDFKTDSLALVALYNSTGGPSWTTKTNWLAPTSTVSTWFGVTVTGQSITSVSLPNNKLTGAVPDPLVDILSLQSLNLSTNAITAIPKFTDSKQITTLNVANNKLEFSSLEPNAPLIKPGIAFTYTGQSDIGTAKTTLADVGSTVNLTPAPEAKSNAYQWKRNGVNINGATTRPYAITNIGRPNMGQYVCEVSNSLIPGLTLKTAPEAALAVAAIDGKLFATTNTAASKGKMFLFKVNPGTAYDTIQVQNVKTDGTYKFNKVVLDDYQILGFSDTLTYKGALPTYYQNTIFWEEANTIPVNENRIDLNVTSNYKPTNVTKGAGVISGFLEEQVLGTGRIQTAKRVSGAGASVRRVEAAGKPTAEKLTLVAYVFTNEQGEFNIPELPKGEYRLNIQYPGYPMDDKSFITIPIGDGLQSQVRVAANVEAGKIKVDKLVVTGLWEQAGYKAVLYPNPTVSAIHLEFGDESSKRFVQLVDVNGREIIKQNAFMKNEEVNVNSLSSGVYILNVFDNEGKVKALRVIVEK